jgi:hypothetical protein
MNLLDKIDRAKRGYEAAKPRSERRTAKYREHVHLKLALLRWKPRKAKRA